MRGARRDAHDPPQAFLDEGDGPVGDGRGRAVVFPLADDLAGLANDPGNAMLSPPFSGDNLYASPSGPTLVPLQALQNNSGGGQPHNNMQPSLPLTFMICVSGIFPPMF